MSKTAMQKLYDTCDNKTCRCRACRGKKQDYYGCGCGFDEEHEECISHVERPANETSSVG